jgi:hypothetical protein
MPQNVQIDVSSGLDKVISELESIRTKASETSQGLSGLGESLGDEYSEQVSRTGRFLSDMGSMGRRVGSQLADDFKALFSMSAISESFNMANTFRDAISESITLSDTVRKFGEAFGIAQKDFASFQASIMAGLGEIGLSGETAAQGLEGLVKTPVRDLDMIKEYLRLAGQLTTITGEQGSEGDVTEGLFRVIQARGGDFNEAGEVRAVAETLRRVFNETGQTASQTLSSLEQIFADMPQDLRKTLGTGAVSNLAAISAVGGPNATAFLEEFLSAGPIQRRVFEAQGGRGVFGDEGLNIDRFREFARGIIGRIGGDPRMAAQTLGLSEEAAEGFVRLYENLDNVTNAQRRMAEAQSDVNAQYDRGRSLGQSFAASLNRVKAMLAEPFAEVEQGATDFFQTMAKSDMGSLAVTAGGGILTALLAGVGLRGVGRFFGGGLAGTVAKGAIGQAVTGESVQPVYVVNAHDMGGNLAGVGTAAGAAAASTMSKVLTKAGLLGSAGVAGVLVGNLLDPVVKKHIDEPTTRVDEKTGIEGNFWDRLFYTLDKLAGGDTTKQLDHYVKQRTEVEVKLQEKLEGRIKRGRGKVN